jgi:hypothetical protein
VIIANKTGGSHTASSSLDTYTFTSASARYVEIAITDGYNATSGVETCAGSIWEFEVYGPTDFHSQYISTFVTNGIAQTTNISTNPPTQKINGSISKFAVVQVDATTTANSITPTGKVTALYCPIVQTSRLAIPGNSDSTGLLSNPSAKPKPSGTSSGSSTTTPIPHKVTPTPTAHHKKTPTPSACPKPHATTHVPTTTAHPKKPKSTTPKPTTHKPTTHKPHKPKHTTPKPTTPKPTTPKPRKPKHTTTTTKPTTPKPKRKLNVTATPKTH